MKIDVLRFAQLSRLTTVVLLAVVGAFLVTSPWHAEVGDSHRGLMAVSLGCCRAICDYYEGVVKISAGDSTRPIADEAPQHRGGRAGQQDGAYRLGDDDQGSGLPAWSGGSLSREQLVRKKEYPATIAKQAVDG